VTKKCDNKTVDSRFLSRNSQVEKKNLTTSEVEIWQISMARMGDSIQALRSLLSHDKSSAPTDALLKLTDRVFLLLGQQCARFLADTWV
jgi:hypothetical protein